MLWCVTNGRAVAPPRDRVQQGRLDLDESLRPQPLAACAARRRCAAAGAGGCARWPTGRPRAGGTASRCRSRPATCRRSCARASASSSHPVTFTESSPRFVRTTSPTAPTQSPRLSLVNSSKRSVTFARANSCTDPELSRSSANASLPCGRESMTRPATPTVTPDSSPGASDDQASTTAAASMGALETVRDLGPGRAGRGPGRGVGRHPLTLRSNTMRRPCRVSQGSTCSMVSEYGAMSELKPPVATTVEGPSSSMKRRTRPSTSPAKP